MDSIPEKSLIEPTKVKLYQPDEYLPFKAEYIDKYYPGSTLVGEFALSSMNDNVVIRWYKQENPDRAKGHKDYFGLLHNGNGYMITGIDSDRMDKERFRQGLHCLICGDTTYSRSRHDYHHCSCGNAMVDGGPAYFKAGWKDKTKVKEVKIDLVKQEVVDE